MGYRFALLEIPPSQMKRKNAKATPSEAHLNDLRRPFTFGNCHDSMSLISKLEHAAQELEARAQLQPAKFFN